MTQQVPNAYPYFTDQNGKALDMGFVYIGSANQDPVANPIAVYWDDAKTIQATQPLRTALGYIYRSGSPANVYPSTDGLFSIRVTDRNGRVIYTAPSVQGFDRGLRGELDDSGGSVLVGYIQAGTGAVARTAQAKLRERITPEDYGADGDGVADDTDAINDAVDYIIANGGVLEGSGTYRTTSTLNLRYISVNITGQISVDHTGIGVLLGNTQQSQSGPKQEIQTILRTTGLDATNPTVRVIGAKGQVIAVHRTDYFQIYADTASAVYDTDSSTAYSTFHIQRCEKIELTNNPANTTAGTGAESVTQWINENSFYIGRTNDLIVSGTYGHNHNQFHAGAFENAGIDFQSGSSNILHCARMEGPSTVNFEAGTFGNKVIQSWCSNQRSDYEDATPTVTDDGEGNIVAMFSESFRRELPIVTVNPQTCLVFATANTLPATSLRGVFLNAYGVNKFSATANKEMFSTDEFGNIRLLAGEAIRFRSSAGGKFRVRIYMYHEDGTQITGATDPGYMRCNATTVWSASGYYAQSSDVEYVLAILKGGTPVHTVWVRVFSGSSPVPFSSFELTLMTTVRDTLSQSRSYFHSDQPPVVSSSPVIGYAPNAGYKVSNTAGGWFTATFALKTALSAAGAAGAASVTVTTVTGIASGDVIGIELTSGATHWTTVSGAPSGSSVPLTVALPSAATSGAPVVFNRWTAS